MPLELLITFTDGESLGAADLNASLNHLLTYDKQNKDRIVGDNAESSDVTAHDHEGTYGVALGTAALDDLAVTTAKINDLAVTTGKINDDAVRTIQINDSAVTAGKIGANAVITTKILNANVTLAKLESTLQYAIRSQRLTHSELVYGTTDLVTVTFPWTEPGGTAWSNVTGIDVSKNVAASGHVKDGTTANEASKWYYLYISNTYTLAQPTAVQFLFTQSAAGETGYTLVGAIYNNAAQAIEPFDQHNRIVMWRDPIKVENAGTDATAWGTAGNDIDCSIAVPVNAIVIKLTGIVTGTADSSAGTAVYCYISKNGITPADDGAQILAATSSYVLNSGTIFVNGNRDIQSDTSQVIEYKVANNNAGDVNATIYVTGYHVR